MNNRLKTKDNAKLTFEYFNNNKKLTLPLFYNSLIDSIDMKNTQNFYIQNMQNTVEN